MRARFAGLFFFAVAGACGARTDPFTAVPDTNDSSTLVDVRVADSFVAPDATKPDTFVADSFVSDSFAPDTFAPDTFAPDTLIDDVVFDVAPETPVAVLDAKSMSLGDDHTCVLASDGTARCWGLNENGQLGDGTTTERASPGKVLDVAAAEEIVAGGRHNCVRTTSDAVLCWGWNERGQLGDGTFVDRTRPVSVSVHGVVQIAGGHWHTCVTLADGTARCWGEDAKGQLGDGGSMKSATPVVVNGGGEPLSNVARVAAGCEHTCAVTTDHRAFCWGDNAFGQIDPTSIVTSFSLPRLVPLDDVVDISLGCYATCMRNGAGATACFGYVPPTGPKSPPTAPTWTGGGVKQIAMSSADGVVLLYADGHIEDRASTWPGSGGAFDEAGVDATETGPGLDPIGGAIEVAAGWRHTCARRLDGTVWCSGFDQYGELGRGSTSDAPQPPAPTLPF